MSIFRRILGLLMLLVGIAGLVIAGAAAYFANQAIDTVVGGLNSTVDMLGTTVDTSTASLENVKATLTETGATLETVSATASNAAITLSDTQPLLEQMTTLTTDTLPTSLEAVNAAVPNRAGIAGSIDATLTRLSDFKFQRTIATVPISFDLGINYAPEEPFDKAVLKIGESLVDVPGQLRALENSLQTSVTNIGAVSENIADLSGNITDINTTVQQYIPLLDQYIGVLNQTAASLDNTRAQINANLGTIKWVATGLMAWFALYQIVPLYVGYRMLSDKVVEGTFEERVDEMDDRPATYAAAEVGRAEAAAAEAEEAAVAARDAAEDTADAAADAARAAS